MLNVDWGFVLCHLALYDQMDCHKLDMEDALVFGVPVRSITIRQATEVPMRKSSWSRIFLRCGGNP